jgi:hypothetical protein
MRELGVQPLSERKLASTRVEVGCSCAHADDAARESAVQITFAWRMTASAF